ncbi:MULTISPECIES: alpha/beta fold hydrolase [unclassified Streptomyces]|uniref:alpha/beta fold hydrolase n=1 Tax=unclassified Streptomyces TaxID=2593676 RepID=UPI00336A3A5F
MASPSAAPTRTTGSRPGTVAVAAGVTVHYDDLGGPDSVPVLLVHGHPFNRGMWRRQVDALVTAGYRVVVPDLRGYGESTVVPGKTLLSDFAQDLAAVLDHLGVARAVVVGLSMGGQITMEFHQRYPDKVAALVLADTSPIAETDQGRAFRTALADRLLAEGMDGYAAEVIDKMILPRHVADLPEVAEHVLGMVRGTAPAGAAAALRGRAERPDYRRALHEVRVPTLVVVGADDPCTPVEQARLIHESVVGSALSVIDDAAHLPNLEQPERFNAGLLAFLDAHRTTLAPPHPLLTSFLDAADGRFPPADGAVTVLPGLPRGLECSVAFTGHAVVATALPAARVHPYRPDGFGGSLTPDFLRALAGPAGWIGDVDATLVRRGTGGTPRLQPLTDADDHPRVRYARHVRTGIRVFGDDRGLVTLSAGLAGRTELSIELRRPEDGGRGHGRSLLADALTLVPEDQPLFAAVSPGNARSLRAFLAAGFTPIGAEALIRPDRSRT